MNWKKHKDRHGKRGTYHHGNLREALIDAALGLIAKKGPEGFTFAEAAREAGVSAAAPYRHFRDREELVVQVARKGFEKFDKQLASASKAAGTDSLARLKAIGKAYLKFARSEPALYSAMFESGIPANADRDLQAACDNSFDLLRDTAQELCDSINAENRPPAVMVALHIWSMTHGIASLFARGDAARRPLPMSAEDLLEAGILVYLDGLGLKR